MDDKRIRFKRQIKWDGKAGESDRSMISHASLVIDRSNGVIKDREGTVPRTATQQELESCKVIN